MGCGGSAQVAPRQSPVKISLARVKPQGVIIPQDGHALDVHSLGLILYLGKVERQPESFAHMVHTRRFLTYCDIEGDTCEQVDTAQADVGAEHEAEEEDCWLGGVPEADDVGEA
mmetsp:Transcript_12624/g.23757  ORF Transcript_12624/g.23757 Transcript_12624/m.23757 type:complete len:114 (-) Transcript_12624:168-509(-)